MLRRLARGELEEREGLRPRLPRPRLPAETVGDGRVHALLGPSVARRTAAGSIRLSKNHWPHECKEQRH